MARDWRLVGHSILFVTGFTLVFAIFGVLIEVFFAQLGYQLNRYISYVGGAIIVGFGLLLLGVLKIPFLEQERRIQVQKLKYPSLTSFLFGAGFGAGWSPCVGAILGAIITLASTQPTNALLLMLAYSVGLGIPFILAGVFAEYSKGFVRRLGDKLATIQKVLGVVLIALGIMIFSEHLLVFAELTAQSDLFNWIDTTLASAGVNLFIAFVAGIASFLSPCVLPLLPVYLAYLAGLTIQESTHNQ